MIERYERGGISVVDTRREQERDKFHRAIWIVDDVRRGAVDGGDFKSYVLSTVLYRYIFLLILLLVLMVVMLTSCGNKPQSEELPGAFSGVSEQSSGVIEVEGEAGEQPEQEREEETIYTGEAQGGMGREEQKADAAESEEQNSLLLYAPVIEMYQEAMRLPLTEDLGILLSQQWPEVNSNMLWQYASDKAQGNDLFGFFIAFYDIDRNGTEEMLIGCTPWGADVTVIDGYALQGSTPVKLQFEDPDMPYDTLGERSHLTIHSDGSILLVKSSGAESTQYEVLYMAADGYSLMEPEILLDTETEPELLGQDLDAVVIERLGGAVEKAELEWIQIEP